MPTRRTPHPDWVITRRRDLGQRIGDLRRTAGLSQDDLADRIGMERRSIQRYESGERDPRFSELLLVAEALAVDVTELMK
ncbi:helix-turn-helix domain-containing protein [Streptomyces sp. NPDC056049]|uniref:helix-turn-helix domain-containing protein n=1 Tax=Streptomyces sp. NPDC056049 TaxID=3345693 RepID=UPI0035DB1F61